MITKAFYWNNFEDKKKLSSIKQFNFVEKNISYTNLNVLKKFLTKFGKIKSKRKTHFTSKFHRIIAKTIKKSREFKLIPTNSSIRFN